MGCRKHWLALVAKRCRRTDRLATGASWGSEPITNVLIGYARISTGKQDLALQLDALERAGCERTFKDTASGALKSRPELEACPTDLELAGASA